MDIAKSVINVVVVVNFFSKFNEMWKKTLLLLVVVCDSLIHTPTIYRTRTKRRRRRKINELNETILDLDTFHKYQTLKTKCLFMCYIILTLLFLFLFVYVVFYFINCLPTHFCCRLLLLLPPLMAYFAVRWPFHRMSHNGYVSRWIGECWRITDERDAIQKKTFTKWVNKHLKKVIFAFCESIEF